LVGGLASNIPEASAHENRLYNIGNKDYWITVGSINESVFVDDKSGAEVFIKAADTSSPLNSNANGPDGGRFGIIGITGLTLAWLHIQSMSELFISDYGRILIVKLRLALPVVIIG